MYKCLSESTKNNIFLICTSLSNRYSSSYFNGGFVTLTLTKLHGIIGSKVPLYTVLRTYVTFQISVVFNDRNGPVDLNFNTEEVYVIIRNAYVEI